MTVSIGTSLTPRSRTREGSRRLARAATAAGAMLSYSSLALGGTQFYKVSAAKLGPGAFMLSMPKLLAGSLAPLLAIAGAAGAGLAMTALWLDRGRLSGPRRRARLAAVAAGAAGATLNAVQTRRVTASRGNFADAFGDDWGEQIPSQLKGGMLARRWTWDLRVAPGAHVERDVAFATVPGTDRKLLADLWSPPDGVAHSTIGFIYLHGGGYSAFDKGGPTELWFRHLAAQGHVVMDVSYRLIPETNLPGMVGDVKRAIAWLKRNGGRYRVEPGRIVLGGGSAGSHLALLAAYAPSHPRFTPEDVRNIDLSVRGVIGYYNAGDYRLENAPVIHKNAVERALTGALISVLSGWARSDIAVDATGAWDARLFLGGQPDKWPELYRLISPIVHVGADTPPTMQLVGEHDVYVSGAGFASGVGAGRALHRALLEAGVPSVYVEFPRTDHAFDIVFPRVSPSAQGAMYDVDRFLALMAAPVDWKAAVTRRLTHAGE